MDELSATTQSARADEAPLGEAVRSALARGDADAWERIYRDVQGQLFGYCRRLAGSEQDALDLMQDAFLGTMRTCRGGNVPSRMRPYLFTAARNVHLRTRARDARSTPGGTDDVGTSAEAPPRLEDAPELGALVGAQRGDVLAALDALPDRQRAALALCELEGCSYAEVGDALGIDENAVAQLLFRARAKLKLLLRLREVDEQAMPEECRDRLPEISRLLDDGVRQPALGELLEHLHGCEHCTRARADMQLVRERYRALVPALPLAGGGWEQLAPHAAADGLLQAEGGSSGADQLDFDASHGADAGASATSAAARRLLLAVGACAVIAVVAAVAYQLQRGGTGPTSAVRAERPSSVTAGAPADDARDAPAPRQDAASDDPVDQQGPGEDAVGTTEPTEPEPTRTDPSVGEPTESTDEPAQEPLLPNLVASGVTLRGSEASVIVANVGAGPAGTAAVVITVAGKPYQLSVPALVAGASTTARVETGCTEGSFELVAMVDPDDAITESDEADNSATSRASNVC